MHDRGWKAMIVGYGGLNQQRVYNPRTRRIHVLVFIQFNEGFSYYDTSHETTNKDDENTEVSDIQNEVDDDKFGKVMARKQVVGKETILANSTLQSKERSVIADSKNEGDNNSLFESAANNNHPLPNQSMPPPTVPNEILSPLTDISETNTPLPSKTFHDPEDEEDLPKLPNILQGNHTTDQSRSPCQSCTKSGVLKRVDYKNPRRLGKSMLVSYNVFHAKHIPQSHIHMV